MEEEVASFRRGVSNRVLNVGASPSLCVKRKVQEQFWKRVF